MVITGLTRNQLGRKVSWVRIPPAPPDKKRTHKPLTKLMGALFLCPEYGVIFIPFFSVFIFYFITFNSMIGIDTVRRYYYEY